MRKPGYGVALAAAGGVLDQVAPARARPRGVLQELAHYVELVVAREDLHTLLRAAPARLRLQKLRVVLDDVRQRDGREDPLPKIAGLEAAGVRRVARAVVVPLVERQEPGRLALQVGAEPHLVIVHGEMRQASADLEQPLTRVAVAAVLLDGVVHGLFGEAVLQLEGRHRQAVDEDGKVERKLGLVAAVAKLPRDAEDVGREPLGGRGVAGGRRSVEEVHVVRPVLDPVSQHVHDAAPADFALQPCQEVAPGGAFLAEVERFGRVRLCFAQESGELGQIHAVFALVVFGASGAPAGGSHLVHDEGLKPLFAGVAGHFLTYLSPGSSRKVIHQRRPVPQPSRPLRRASRLPARQPHPSPPLAPAHRAGLPRRRGRPACRSPRRR